MNAIYKREVKSYFHSFIGWLFLAAMLLMMGIYFTFYNILNGYPNISYVLQGVVFLFLFAFPILTMRSFAEERKLKTDQLILTAPISIGKIVLGKYLALLTVFVIPIVVASIAIVVLSFFGDFQVGVSFTALFGFFLYGALGLAIGIFVSSLTESIVISAVLTFIVLFLGYVMPGICSMASPTGNMLTKILSAFDTISRFDRMLIGSFYVPSAVYFLSLSLLFLFFTVQSIEKRRYSISGSGWKPYAFQYGMTVTTIALTVIVNILVGHLPERMISFDVTSNRLYTLTEDTKDFVAGLTEDITIYALVNEEYKDNNLDTTLRKIEDLSDNVKVIYVDPATNPRFYANYTETEPSSNSLIVTGPARSRVIDYNDIYAYEYYSYYEYQITGYDGEGQIIAAMTYVATDDMPKIYVIDGHEELALEGEFSQTIQKKNIAYETLSLLQTDAIPEDAQAIIINAPVRDYSEDDVDKILAYLEKGGNMILITAWTDEALPNFERLLDYYGVSLTDGIILESDKDKYYAEIPYFLFPQIAYDEITESVYETSVFMPYAQGFLYDEAASNDVLYTLLLSSSANSYSKAYQDADFEIMTDFKKAQGDKEGPFAMALKASKPTESGMASNAVFVASELFFTQDADSIVPGNNVKFFGGMIDAFVEHKSSILIPVKYYSTALSFTTNAVTIVGTLSILAIPVSCLIVGFVIWWRRRKK